MTNEQRLHQLIAEVIRDCPALDNRAYNGLITSFVSRLAADNPNFDREKFIAACKGRGQ